MHQFTYLWRLWFPWLSSINQHAIHICASCLSCLKWCRLLICKFYRIPHFQLLYRWVENSFETRGVEWAGERLQNKGKHEPKNSVALSVVHVLHKLFSALLTSAIWRVCALWMAKPILINNNKYDHNCRLVFYCACGII